MKINTFLVGIIVTIVSSFTFGQMINGGFEDYVNTSAPYDFSIENAPGWHNLNNTADLAHPSTTLGGTASHSPRTGNGNARFGSPTNGLQEYFYGTTQNLTSGSTYVVSFWVRKDYTTTKNVQVGGHIGPSVPSQQVVNPYVQTMIPLITLTPTTTEYVKASFCYTATTTGPHFVTIGSFQNNGTGESQLFLVDDVSVVSNSSDAPPNAIVSIPKSVFCIGENVIIDGSASTNDNAYIWKVCQVINSIETLIFQSTAISGSAGQLDINSTFLSINHTPSKGNCYRAYLTVLNGCSSQSSVSFCYDNPNIDFIYNGNPVCQNQSVNLQVTGENGWTYVWQQGDSTLATGVGQKTLAVTPTSSGTVEYTVTVTTPAGCTFTKSLSLVVHSSNNVIPWMNGINGTGEYTAYVSSGDVISFTSTLFNDSNLEALVVTETNNLNGLFTIGLPNSNMGGIVSFMWNTALMVNVPPGSYFFTIKANDNNVCGSSDQFFTFTIIVNCDHCPTCISYENRSSATTPLPPETKVGKCIEAGLTQQVSVGNGPVLFQAGKYILLGPNFDSGTNFQAIIDPGTCLADCNDCCVDWDGFTYDEIPATVMINENDSDPTNDIWNFTDINHPFCAFGALGYSYRVYSRQNQTMIEGEYTGTGCCPLESPAPEHPMPHSPIYWDGYTQNIFGSRVKASDGMYSYDIKLFGCDGAEMVLQGYIAWNYSSGIAQATGGTEAEQQSISTLMQEQEELERKSQNVSLSPNPASSKVTIQGFDRNEQLSIQLYDSKGMVASKVEKLSQPEFDVSRLSNGTYYVRIYLGEQYIVKKFVKI